MAPPSHSRDHRNAVPGLYVGDILKRCECPASSTPWKPRHGNGSATASRQAAPPRCGARAVSILPSASRPRCRRCGVDRDRSRTTPKEARRSEEHTSELQSLMRISYAVFCLKKKTNKHITT